MLICALFFILLPWESGYHSVTTFFVNTANKALFPLQDALLGFPAEYSEVKTSWNLSKWVLKQVHFFPLFFQFSAHGCAASMCLVTLLCYIIRAVLLYYAITWQCSARRDKLCVEWSTQVPNSCQCGSQKHQCFAGILVMVCHALIPIWPYWLVKAFFNAPFLELAKESIEK